MLTSGLREAFVRNLLGPSRKCAMPIRGSLPPSSVAWNDQVRLKGGRAL